MMDDLLRTLSGNELKVWLAIYFRLRQGSGLYYTEGIARSAGLSEPTVRKCMRRLEALGILQDDEEPTIAKPWKALGEL